MRSEYLILFVTDGPTSLTKSERCRMKRVQDTFVNTVAEIISLQNTSVLEIGCGDGHYSEQLAARCKQLTGVDPDKKALELAKQKKLANATFHPYGAESLPFPDETFDVVIFTLSLHHMRPALMPHVIHEAVAVCKRDGNIIILEPGMEGSFYQAEIEFDACDGDEREAKKAARRVIDEHPRLKPVATLQDETVFSVKSPNDFMWALKPSKNLAGIPAFLLQQPQCPHGNRLLSASRVIDICEPAY